MTIAMKKIETIYDHNVTQEELRKINPTPKENYLKTIPQDVAYGDLAWLYFLREDRKKMMFYADRMSAGMRFELLQMIEYVASLVIS
jgi:hypothetical protein